jgi:hypothetical protein
MPVQVILPRRTGASFNGKLAPLIWAVEKRELFNHLFVYGSAVTVKVLPELEGLSTSAHSAFEWSGVLLVMLAARIM